MARFPGDLFRPGRKKKIDLTKKLQTEDFDVVRFWYNTPINKKITR